MKSALVAVLALLAGAALALGLPLSSGAQEPATTTVLQCPPGITVPSPYCQFVIQTTPPPTTTTADQQEPMTTGAAQQEPLEPVADQSVVVRPRSGRVLVRLPGAARFVALTAGLRIPLGTIVDTRNGSVDLTSAPDRSGRTQTANFHGGRFRVQQIRDPRRRGRLITQLVLLGGRPGSCPARGRAHSAAAKPGAHLWGDGKGRFQVRGNTSAATVRGTVWYVAERCPGTYTRVRRGVVEVRDFVRQRTITLRAPHSYLARRR